MWIHGSFMETREKGDCCSVGDAWDKERGDDSECAHELVLAVLGGGARSEEILLVVGVAHHREICVPNTLGVDDAVRGRREGGRKENKGARQNNALERSRALALNSCSRAGATAFLKRRRTPRDSLPYSPLVNRFRSFLRASRILERLLSSYSSAGNGATS